MYRCEQCKKLSEPGEGSFKKVVKTRQVKYPEGTIGTETVQELTVCQPCMIGS